MIQDLRMFKFVEEEGSLSIEMLCCDSRASKPGCKVKAKYRVVADDAWRKTVTYHSELLSAEGERNVAKCKRWMCKSYKLNAPIDQEGSPDLIWHSSP